MRQMREIADWERINGTAGDAARFREGIAPRLRDVTIRTLVQATGVFRLS
jgi:hypothetical protein